MSDQARAGVSLGSTARWTAAVRAREHARADHLFTDPWATALAGEEGEAWIARRPPGSTDPIAIRTRYFDDYLQSLAHTAGIRQIVLMAAGLDTRAYRLTWPAGTAVYELDTRQVLAHKTHVLDAAGATPTCTRHVVPVDLRGPWAEALLTIGIDMQRTTVWLLEGFLFYLPPQALTQLLDQVSEISTPGDRLGFDVVNALTLTFPMTKPWVDMQAEAGAPWLGTMEDPVGFLTERGWSATLTQGGAPDANYGRWTLPVIPVTMPNVPHNWYVTAEKMPG